MRGFRLSPFSAVFLFVRALLFFSHPVYAQVAEETRSNADTDRARVYHELMLADSPEGYEETERSWVLSLAQEDFLAVASPQGGYDLFIRKKPAIACVLLSAFDAANSRAVDYALRTEYWNEVNGDEITMFEGDGREQMWYLIDSTPEYDPLFGEEVFHIYLPPMVYVFYNATPTVIRITEGLSINARAYNMPFADMAASYQDSQYIITTNLSEDTPSLKTLYNANMRYIPVYEPILPNPSFVRLGGGISYFNPGYEGAMKNRSYNLQPQINPLAELTFSHNPVPNFGFMLGFERDSLLLNRIMARVKGDWAVFGFEAGGFLGLLNPDREILSPGVSLVVKTYLWDGFITAQVRFDSALGRALNGPGDFLQDLYEAQLAVKYGWFIFDARGSYRTFVRGTRGRLNITSDWLKIGGGVTLSMDILSFDLGLAGGYQALTLRYPFEDDPLDYSYDNVFIGYNMRFRLPRNIELFFELELPVSPAEYFGQFSSAPSLLRAYVGMLWVLGK
ncbi:MAG: hypothetical protein LBF77_07365 [Spirochaetaceae bacterium]|jgi:hypothetical protein|nr:hypothetical protein [Spirochaetaceae bacterium]